LRRLNCATTARENAAKAWLQKEKLPAPKRAQDEKNNNKRPLNGEEKRGYPCAGTRISRHDLWSAEA